MNNKALHAIVLAALLMSIAVGAQEAGKAQRTDAHAMAPTTDGRPNPKAPEELSQLAFLIGTWRCDVEEKSRDGSWAKSKATWVWRYILDGYVIADEYRQIDSDGALVRLGATYRSFDTVANAWIMRWHDALNSTWLDLGPEDLGGVRVKDTSIIFKHHAPPDGVVRCTYIKRSDDRFTWRGELSTDGQETWNDVMVIDAHRVKK